MSKATKDDLIGFTLTALLLAVLVLVNVLL
jgi:hypothetical protein